MRKDLIKWAFFGGEEYECHLELTTRTDAHRGEITGISAAGPKVMAQGSLDVDVSDRAKE